MRTMRQTKFQAQQGRLMARWLPAMLMGLAAWLPCFAVHSIHALPAPNGAIVLTISGKITHANHPDGAVFDADMLAQLPQHSLHTSTAVTDGVKRFEGVLIRDLLRAVGALGTQVRAQALNNYSLDIPIADFETYDVLLATAMDGERLVPATKGPLWIIYPRDDFRELQDMRYDSRWVWQLNRLIVK